MSERRERSFLRRARESRPTGDEPQPPSGGPEPEPPPAHESDLSPGGLRRGGELRRSMAVAAEGVDQLITAAHQMAEEIRREAEIEADRYLELRHREADIVVEERLSGVRRALNSARLELDDLERRIIAEAREYDPGAPGETVPSPEPATTEPPSRPTPVPTPSAYPGTDADHVSEADPASRWTDDRAAAVIRASQLAVQGESRERIATVLRADFGIERPEEIIDEIFPKRW